MISTLMVRARPISAFTRVVDALWAERLEPCRPGYSDIVAVLALRDAALRAALRVRTEGDCSSRRAFFRLSMILSENRPTFRDHALREARSSHLRNAMKSRWSFRKSR